MKLEKKSLREAEEWKKAGYELPEYDLDIIQANTKKKPTWIHFGAGNIFRAFMAVAQQKLLNEKISDTGIIVCEGYDSEIIEKARDYIGQNYMSENISLNLVASSVNISPSYFSSLFSQEVGSTFVEYLTGVRMEKAKELLMCSDKRTSDIGYEVGYKDSHYFSYIFKKTQGCSPKEFRSRGRG